MIKISNLDFSYNKNEKILNNISLKIKQNEFVAIIGHNGSGKSTLSKILVGILNPCKGSVSINNTILNEENINNIRRDIGIIFQNPDNQFVGSTVEEDIAFGLENIQTKRKVMIKLIEDSSKKVGMFEYLDKAPHNLSGGQKQRVAIAGVIAMNRNIIIFDEATSMLDPNGKKDVIEIIKGLKNDGKTIIMITHDLEEAKLADRIIAMSNGEIILNGSPKDVFEKSDSLKNIGLDIPMALNVLKKAKICDKELSELLWELSLKE